MSDTYRLVFEGEVQPGQHASVVRKRLAGAGFSPEQLERLFCGRAVVLKGDADAATAARYRALFDKAGARLRVDALTPAAPASAAASARFELLPVGSDLLRDEERGAPPPAAPDVSHLSLAEPGAELAPRNGDTAPPPPDVSHLRLAADGE